MIAPYPYKYQRAHIGYHPNNQTIMDSVYITDFFTNTQTTTPQHNLMKEQSNVELLFSIPTSPLPYDDDHHHRHQTNNKNIKNTCNDDYEDV